jgi:hypothetical protein
MTPLFLHLLIIENENSIHASSSNIENKSEARKNDKKLHLSRVLFIGIIKRLKGYYAPMS